MIKRHVVDSINCILTVLGSVEAKKETPDSAAMVYAFVKNKGKLTPVLNGIATEEKIILDSLSQALVGATKEDAVALNEKCQADLKKLFDEEISVDIHLIKREQADVLQKHIPDAFQTEALYLILTEQ